MAASKSHFTIAAGVMLWLALPGTSPAAIRYAEPGGNGPAASCPQSDPCDIQAAVEDASVQGGDEIVVLPGTYALGADPLTAPQAIDLHGADGQARPQLQSSADPAVTARGRIADLEITGSGVFVLTTVGTSPTAERLVVHSTASGGLACSTETSTSLFRDLVCWGSGSNSTGFAFSSGTSATATLRGVTAVGGGTALYADAFQPGTTVTVDARNVIASGGIADAGAFTAGAGTATTTLDYSNYDTEAEDLGGSVTNPGTLNNQTAPPLFANPGLGNFHQVAGSPTRNAGSAAATQIGSLDLDREPRSQESAPDIGADEYDVIPPGTQITGGPPAVTSDPTPSFNFSSDDPRSVFMCAVDGWPLSFGQCSGPGPSHTTIALADGPHTFSVESVDISGNVDPPPAEQGFIVDTRAPDEPDVNPPDTQITGGPPAVTSDPTPSFNLSSDDPFSTFACAVDGRPLFFGQCSGPGSSHTTIPLADGPHSFAAEAIDTSGNIDPTPAEQGFTIDTRAPETTIDKGPDSKTAARVASFRFSADESSVAFDCQLDSEAFRPCASPVKYTKLKRGKHSFDVRSRDAAGNVDALPATRRWRVIKT
jgi:hypothetical protein